MVRQYKKVEGKRRRMVHSDEIMQNAIKEAEKGDKTIAIIAKKYGIARQTLNDRVNGVSKKKIGGQPAISPAVEAILVQNLITCANWGYPMDILDLQLIISNYLQNKSIVVKQFKNNIPGTDFIRNFLKRNTLHLSQRMCNNIKRVRASISVPVIKSYFENLNETLKDVPPQNILNYDESNLTDDPGRKKMIFKRGVKYPDRVMNSTKVSTSIMFCCSGSGIMLPPYVVYKAKHLHASWLENGPKNTRYNRSMSGWFDAICFKDWAETVAIPYLKKLEGKKVLIGDNLSSHLNIELVETCKKHNIEFVFLPPNSTHMTQPLDVSVFRPMKISWRNILTHWKITEGQNYPSLPKSKFPFLLNKLMTDLSKNMKSNILGGFKKCGIVPLNAENVLKSLPDYIEIENSQETIQHDSDSMNESFVSILKTLRHRPEVVKQKQKRLKVPAGQSVSLDEINQPSTSTAAEKKTTSTRRGKRAVCVAPSINETTSESEIEEQPPIPPKRKQQPKRKNASKPVRRAVCVAPSINETTSESEIEEQPSIPPKRKQQPKRKNASKPVRRAVCVAPSINETTSESEIEEQPPKRKNASKRVRLAGKAKK